VDSILAFIFGDGLCVSFPDGTTLVPSRAIIVGPNLSLGTRLFFDGTVDLFAVFFQPAGFFDLFGVPINGIINTYYDAATVLDGAPLLWEQLAEAGSFAERVRVADRYLLSQVARARAPSDMHAANTILRLRGVARIRALAAVYGLSVRQFERRFAVAVGVAPKAFARVARFQSALDAKVVTPTRTWCDVAHELGYHDQMHLVHDFEQISGSSPQQLMNILGDARPPALAAQTGGERAKATEIR
jgi:AraC-like DNA-binding protein